MAAVRLQRCPVGELHDASQFIALRARREIHAHPRLLQSWNPPLQISDRVNDLLPLLVRDSRLPAKYERMNHHGPIVESPLRKPLSARCTLIGDHPMTSVESSLFSFTSAKTKPSRSTTSPLSIAMV